MEARNEHQQIQRFNIIYGVATGIGSLLVVLVIVWASYYRGGFAWTSNPTLEFNWHPVLMIISLIFLYSQCKFEKRLKPIYFLNKKSVSAILIYRSKRDTLKKKLKLLHTFINVVAFILAVIGLQAAFDSHNLAQPPIENLYTLHSWIGLITVMLFAGQVLLIIFEHS